MTDIEWAKKEIEKLTTEESQNYPHDEMVEKEIVLGILNQLGELEVLTPDWIERNTSPVDDEGRLYIWKKDLQKVVVQKQELPSIPKWFDKWWKGVPKGGGSLFHNIDRFYDELFSSGTRESYNYISDPDNKKKLLNIIVNELDYVVEEEQKYTVSSPKNESGFWFLCKNSRGKVVIGTNKDYFNYDWDSLKLTEKEIKDFDERYFAFATKVEVMEVEW